jgi:acetolactate synthase-1/2/3 large subunit
MLAVGTRLRSNETLKYELAAAPALRIDAAAAQQGRCYADDGFVCGDAALALAGLADRLEAAATGPTRNCWPTCARRTTRRCTRCATAWAPTRAQQLQQAAGRNFNWVRDVTVSNSTWGNRELRFFEPNAGVHATGGGIGQGLPMAIGAAIGAPPRLGPQDAGPGRRRRLHPEPGRARHAGAGTVRHLIVLMNDKRYGVIKNIQDAQYGGRRATWSCTRPTTRSCAPRWRCRIARERPGGAAGQLDAALKAKGPFMLEIDMLSIGSFKTFAGPPVNKLNQIPALDPTVASSAA